MENKANEDSKSNISRNGDITIIIPSLKIEDSQQQTERG